VAKTRLDVLLSERGITRSRRVAHDLIKAGEVRVDGQVVSKPSALVSPKSVIDVISPPEYVSRGGLKLKKALDSFGINVDGLIVLDVGSSRGGFTDCLLKRGARKVYAVDVGKGQLDHQLRGDPRVVAREETDIRELGTLPELVDLATVDVSFISLTQVLPSVRKFLQPGGKVIALIKPQFESGPRKLGKEGVVKDPALLGAAVRKIENWADENGWDVEGLEESPIKGASGNTEYLVYLVPRKPVV